MSNDSKTATVADYIRMAEDCLDQSWEAGESHEYRTLSVARAQVYSTLALATATAAEKARQLGAEEVEHYARLEAMEREL